MSHDIAARCIKLIPWQDIASLHIYVPVLKEHEPDSWPVLEYSWQNYPQITTAVPVRNKTDEYGSMVVTPETKWLRRNVRIPRPLDDTVLAKGSKFDVIIVPMLGFDKQGYRLGHGKGWYDRFLPTQPNAQTIGLCYEFGLVPEGLPHEDHDVPVDYVITEISTYKTV